MRCRHRESALSRSATCAATNRARSANRRGHPNRRPGLLLRSGRTSTSRRSTGRSAAHREDPEAKHMPQSLHATTSYPSPMLPRAKSAKPLTIEDDRCRRVAQTGQVRAVSGAPRHVTSPCGCGSSVQTAHGASPESQRAWSVRTSRRASIGCQKPRCRYATSSPSAARPSSGGALEERVVAVDAVEDGRLEDEEPAVHPGAVADRLLLEGSDARRHDPADDLVVVDLEGSEAARSAGPP